MTNEAFIRICEFEELINILHLISGLDLTKTCLRGWLKENCSESNFSCHTEPEEEDLPF